MITRKQNSGGVRAGDTLTFNGEIISISGMILQEKGSTGIVSYMDVVEGFWSKLCPDIWIPERINTIKLEGISGHWATSAFIETQHLK
jgi:hypothetical protein